jgi:hypothetical protein
MNEKKFSKNNSKLFPRLLAIPLVLGITVSYTQAAKAENTQDSGSQNLLEVLSGIIDSFLNFQIPNLDSIISSILHTPNPEKPEDDSPSRRASKVLENKPIGSYAIDEDEAEAGAREATIKATQDATLGEEAQKKLKETSKNVGVNVQTSTDLGEESQTLDVTQQILQNISKQESLNAEREGVIIQQSQQAQVDRAINNVLNTKQLEELSGANTAKRREDSAAANFSTSQ